MGYDETQASRAEQRLAQAWTARDPWFEYKGPAGEQAVMKWKAHDPGPYPAPDSEVYQAYNVDRYCNAVIERVRTNGGMMMWGNAGHMLVVEDHVLHLKDGDEKLVKDFFMEGWNARHGDMGTFALFRFGWMIGDLNLNDYLMDDAEKLELATADAMEKLAQDKYKGNPKAFTSDTGFLVQAIKLEAVYNEGVWIGYRSIMDVDWTRQVNTKKPSVGFYG